MIRVCKNCNSRVENSTVYCPVCGKRLESGEKTGNSDGFFRKIFSFIHLFVSAFFDPISFYRQSPAFAAQTYFIIPGVFWLLFFGDIVVEKLRLGYFNPLRGLIVFLICIFLAVFLYAVSVAVVYYSAKFSAGDCEIQKIIKTAGAAHFLPAVIVFFGFISDLVFNTGSYSLSLTGLVMLFVPYFLMTSELNRKKSFMTYLPTAVVGLIYLIFISFVCGLKF